MDSMAYGHNNMDTQTAAKSTR